jgi:hypothetical protein
MIGASDRTWEDQVLEDALNECRSEYEGRGPCYKPSYLMARHKYHKLLVARGLLSPHLAEPDPRIVASAENEP